MLLFFDYASIAQGDRSIRPHLLHRITATANFSLIVSLCNFSVGFRTHFISFRFRRMNVALTTLRLQVLTQNSLRRMDKCQTPEGGTIAAKGNTGTSCSGTRTNCLPNM
jgi:hypothetical protein